MTGLPLKSPSFVSPWFKITSNPSGQHRLDIDHDLGEIPVYVQVQVKSISDPNKDFMFPAMGKYTFNHFNKLILYVKKKLHTHIIYVTQCSCAAVSVLNISDTYYEF